MAEIALPLPLPLPMPEEQTTRLALPSVKTSTVTIILAALVLLLVTGTAIRSQMVRAAERAEAVSHCRQIITGLRLYGSDNNGNYPYGVTGLRIVETPMGRQHEVLKEAQHSNEVFREVFKCGDYWQAKDEAQFGCPHSPFKPDGQIGTDFFKSEALKKGENHWAMVADLNDSVPGDYPLILENPVNASNPPRWNADVAGRAESGRCWPGASVLVGFSDSAVKWVRLKSSSGSEVELMPEPPSKEYPAGHDLFVDHEGKKLRILQVDE